MKIFSERMRELREERKWKQKDIAEALGISVTCYAGYEQGYRLPNIEMLAQIAVYFGVSSDYLLGLEDEAGNRPHIKP